MIARWHTGAQSTVRPSDISMQHVGEMFAHMSAHTDAYQLLGPNAEGKITMAHFIKMLSKEEFGINFDGNDIVEVLGQANLFRTCEHTRVWTCVCTCV